MLLGWRDLNFGFGESSRGEFMPRQTRQLPRAVDLKGGGASKLSKLLIK